MGLQLVCVRFTMRIVYLQNIVVGLKLMTMYKANADWNIVQKVLYNVWRCAWYYSLLSAIAFLILDIFVNEERRNIVDIAISLMHLALFLSITIRGVHVMLDFDKVEEMLRVIRTEFKPTSSLAKEPVTIDETHRFCEKFYVVWTLFVSTAGLLFCARALINEEREMPLPYWTFYDWRRSPYFEVTVLVQTISQLNMVISFSNLDMLSVGFMKLAAKQYDILAADFGSTIEDALRVCGCPEAFIQGIADGEDVENVEGLVRMPQFQDRLTDNFNSCIEHHRTILQVITEYQSFISPHLLIESYFIFCYMVFALYLLVSTNDTSFHLALSSYLLGAMLQIYLLCSFGQMLTSNGEKARISVYSIPWYIVRDKKFLLDLQFVLLKMQKPVKIVAGKILPLALDSFLEFMKKAFSVYTVLRQMR